MPLDAAVLPVPPMPRHAVPSRRWLVHGGWLFATLLATTFFGGWHYVEFLTDFGQAPEAVSPWAPSFWLGGLWFSLPVLAILGTHEAGHYVACRRYDVDASLPFFLPAPLPLTGTFGAFIRIRGIIPDTRALFDIGASGPFAGFVVAVPLLVAGLWLSRAVPAPDAALDMLELGEPLLFQLVAQAIWGTLPDGQVLHLHPIALAAWFGLLATALNLFPLAQLDGGHVAYAVFGPRARWITIGTTIVVVALTLVSVSWIAWALLVVLGLVVGGVTHPPTANDALPLGRGRMVLALAAVVMFVLCFTPAPVEPIEGVVPPGAPSASR